MANKFSANASTIGYLYQIRFALFVLLQKIEYNPNAQISIEKLDDVAFEKNDQPVELLQLKHHININKKASLTNSSSDLWKTIRIWSEKLLEDPNVFQELFLVLVTTASASQGSIASRLRHDGYRDEKKALGKMLKVIEDTTSKDAQTQACYNSFKQLSKQQQQLLVSKIEVIDQSANILEIEQKIVKKLRLATPYPKALKSRLEGWWFERVVNHLMDEIHKPIRGEELQSQIDNILNELKPDNLPNDFPALIKKDKSDLSSNELVFVAQLELIELTDNRLRTAIGDYYRAFTQRTKWLSDGLIMPDELEKYETILIGEWQRYFEIMKEEMGNNLPDENRMIELGKSIFKWAETSNHTPIRRDFSGDFARGSYHILSKDLKVGWHPEFQIRLGHLITQAVSQLV